MNQNKIVCLLGGACTGKDTVRSILLEDYAKELNVCSAVSTTTRPLREGEQHGVHYYFITNEEFDTLHAFDEFVEVRTYKVADGSLWQYGYTSEEIDFKLANHNIVIVVDLEGFMVFKALYGDRCVGIYLNADRDTRIQRYLNRDKITFEVVEEAVRRIKDDDERAFENVENWVDTIFANYDSSKHLAKDIAEYLKTVEGL